jgi:hypothetical protein
MTLPWLCDHTAMASVLLTQPSKSIYFYIEKSSKYAKIHEIAQEYTKNHMNIYTKKHMKRNENMKIHNLLVFICVLHVYRLVFGRLNLYLGVWTCLWVLGPGPGQDRVRTRPGPGQDRAKTGPGPGQDQARTGPGPGQYQARTRPGPGQDRARTRPGPGQDQARTGPGPGREF